MSTNMPRAWDMRVEGCAVLSFCSFLEGQIGVSISNPAFCTLRIGYADHIEEYDKDS
jgi:hypothetical protein